MCNLYRLSKSSAEIARLFNATETAASNAGGGVYPGYPGHVIAGGRVSTMTWGFPLSLRGATGQRLKPRPVNNARSDKLGSPMWSASFRERRCIIPIDAFAEAEGKKGAKTRTWFSSPDGATLGCAGVWRDSSEWGKVYSLIMTDANASVSPVHNRMPVILAPADWSAWLALPVDEAKALCKPYEVQLQIERTSDLWTRR